MLQEILSCKRISIFLSTLDIEYFGEISLKHETTPPSDNLYIRGNVTWGSSVSSMESQFELQDLDLHFPRGKITLITGKFGSGYTLLLLSLLGEAKLLKGDISYLASPVIPGKVDNLWSLLPNAVAYAPQVSSSTYSGYVSQFEYL